MGVCDSTTKKHQRPRRNTHSSIDETNTSSNKSKNSIKKIDSNKDYILPFSYVIHDDIRSKYTLTTEFIGQGATGTVFEATDKSGKKYAIKCINKTSIHNPDDIIREAKISMELNYPHLIKYYEIYEDIKTISFVMDLVEGGDLFDFILKAPNGKLEDKQALDLITQILETLNYLHNEKHICHRDIKPENFLVSIEDSVPVIKMIDFGFATYVNEEKKMTQYLGTPNYLAPEMINREPYNEKIDVWACGIILFNMLTGCQPFNSHGPLSIEEQINSEPISFGAIENNYLRSLCVDMLEREAEQRFTAKRALDFARSIKDKI